MSEKKKHLFQDFALLAISVGLAVLFVETGLAHKLVASLDGLRWLGIIVAGSFFTSAITTAPSIAILGTFAETTSLPELVILGAIGAVCGDYIIFRFVRDRMAKDFEYLLSFSKGNRFAAIFHARIFRFFVPFLGALIIASPLPDEIGVGMLGISKIKGRTFFLLSFVANGVGIFLIGLAVKTVLGY